MLVRWRGRSSLFNSSYLVLRGLGIGSTQSTTFVHLALALEAKDIAVAETTWFPCQSADMLVAANIFNMIDNLALTGILKCSVFFCSTLTSMIYRLKLAVETRIALVRGSGRFDYYAINPRIPT